MLPEVAHLLLILGLMTSLAQVLVANLGIRFNYLSWIKFTRDLTLSTSFLLLGSILLLAYSFAINDFTVQYVAQHSNWNVPLIYRLTAVWGAHEGSLLLWVTVLNLWATLWAYSQGQRVAPELAARTLGIMALLSCGFILFILLFANPFVRLIWEAPLHGQEITPILQDPGLVIHPPFLYSGYVGFGIIFALSLAGLIQKISPREILVLIRPWTLAAWSLLTCGITLGSFWAYYELGWGGFWFWDPVENASFIPWLAATALIHALELSKKKANFANWGIFLALTTFTGSLLGTFLVRSGIVQSVHAFANDSQQSLYFLSLITAYILAGFIIFACYLPAATPIQTGTRYFQTANLLFANNILLFIITLAIALGTLYPLLLDLFNITSISVGPQYFNAIFAPLMLPILLLLPLADRKLNFNQISKLLIPGILSLLASGIFIRSSGFAFHLQPYLFISLAIFIMLNSAIALLNNFKQNLALKLSMHLAHFAIGMILIGIVTTVYYEEAKDLALSPQATTELGPYKFHFANLIKQHTSNYDAYILELEVFNSQGKKLAILHPEQRYYFNSKSWLSHTSQSPSILRDLYAALGEEYPDHSWSLRIAYKPLVRWIWAGGFLLMLSAWLAIWRKRKCPK